MEGGFFLLTFILLQAVQHSSQSIDELIQEAYRKDSYSRSGGQDETDILDYPVDGKQRKYVKVQLDMIIPKDEWNEIKEWNAAESENTHRRKKRKGTTSRGLLWKDGLVPYDIIDDDFDASEKDAIYQAMQAWQRYTCVDFIHSKDLPPKRRSKIRFMEGEGCSSNVGRVGLGVTQIIKLSPSCRKKDIIIHEIGHALGLYHEHMRPDRDDFVTVNEENIIPGKEENFLKRPLQDVDTDTVPYDYTSIMHYGKLFLSINKTKASTLYTIEPYNVSYLDVIGEAVGASFTDVKMVNYMYGCSDRCMNRTCPPGGFLGVDCRCFCPGNSPLNPVVACRDPNMCSPPVRDLEIYGYWYDNWIGPVLANDSDIAEGDSVIVQCASGKEEDYDKLSRLTCARGQWTGDLPSCSNSANRPCPVPVEWLEDHVVVREDRPENDDVILTVPSGDNVMTFCKIDSSKTNIVSCHNGVWSSRPDQCIVPDECVVPPIDTSSFFVWTRGLRRRVTDRDVSFNVGDILVIICRDRRRAITTCTVNGQWDKWGDFCAPRTCMTPVADRQVYCLLNENREDVGSVVHEYEPGDALLVGCTAFPNRNHSRYVCNEGVWDGTLPDCSVCTVDELDQAVYTLLPYSDYYPSSQEEILNETFNAGDHMAVSCRDQSDTTTTTLLTCREGQWEGELPACQDAEAPSRVCVLTNLTAEGIHWMSVDFGYYDVGDVIPNGEMVIAACEIFDYNTYYDYYQSSFGTEYESNMTCIDGILKGSLPMGCATAASRNCTPVENGEMEKVFHYDYKVTCLQGYHLNTFWRTFTCENNEWTPVHPVCQPDPCHLQEFVGYLRDEVGSILIEEAVLESGQTLEYLCPDHTYPARTRVTCQNGRLDTDTGQLPLCIEVSCPSPNISKVSYFPRKSSYRYGEHVSVGNCKGNLEFVGNHSLHCQADGTWSGSAACQEFCIDGVLKAVRHSHKTFAYASRKVEFQARNRMKCVQKCVKYKRFLCLSITYGKIHTHDQHKVCTLYDTSPAVMPDLLRDRRWWEVIEVQCQR